MKNIQKWKIFIFVNILSIFFLLGGYLMIQQSNRMGANELPAQLIADALYQINSGEDVSKVVPSQIVDLSQSDSSFIMVFNSNYDVLYTNAVIGDKAPALPQGVLDYAKANGENRVTWQPTEGVREAIVVKPVKTDSFEGYVLAGRSLKEVERTASEIFKLVFLLCGIITILNIVVVFFIL